MHDTPHDITGATVWCTCCYSRCDWSIIYYSSICCYRCCDWSIIDCIDKLVVTGAAIDPLLTVFMYLLLQALRLVHYWFYWYTCCYRCCDWSIIDWTNWTQVWLEQCILHADCCRYSCPNCKLNNCITTRNSKIFTPERNAQTFYFSSKIIYRCIFDNICNFFIQLASIFSNPILMKVNISSLGFFILYIFIVGKYLCYYLLFINFLREVYSL